MQEDPKAKSKSVSLLPELWEKVEARAIKGFGSRSAYFRALVEQDLNNPFEPSSDTTLADLARQFRPSLVTDLETAKFTNPSRVIDNLLEALVNALHIPGFNPEKPFRIFNDEASLAAAISSKKFMQQLIVAATGKTQAEAEAALADVYPSPMPRDLSVNEAVPEAPIIQALTHPDRQATPSAHKPTPTPPKQKPTAQD